MYTNQGSGYFNPYERLVPQSPFDYTYGTSMLPRQLLAGSPYVSGIPSPGPLYHPGFGPDGYAPHAETRLGGRRGPRSSHELASQRSRLERAFHAHISSPTPGPLALANTLRRTVLLSDVTIDAAHFRWDAVFDQFTGYGPFESIRYNDPQLRLTFASASGAGTYLTHALSHTADLNRRFTALAQRPHNISVVLVLTPEPIPLVVAAINDGATRCLYISNLPPATSPVALTLEIERSGCVDLVQTYAEEGSSPTSRMIVHFTSIEDAIRCKTLLAMDAVFHECLVFYGHDRCAPLPACGAAEASTRSAPNTPTRSARGPFPRDSSISLHSRKPSTGNLPINGSTGNLPVGAPIGNLPVGTPVRRHTRNPSVSGSLVYPSLVLPPGCLPVDALAAAAYTVLTTTGGAANAGNRTLHIATLHPQARVDEICNVVRGGLLQSVRLLPERHMCFVTFLEASAAARFYAEACMDTVVIHGKRAHVNWGKPSGPCPPAVMLAVTGGASRNVYVRATDTHALPPALVFRADLALYGETEQINYVPKKGCAFINFLQISAAIRLIEDHKRYVARGELPAAILEERAAGVKALFEKYSGLRFAFGKDRCGNPPKPRVKKPAAHRELPRRSPVDAATLAAMGIVSAPPANSPPETPSRHPVQTPQPETSSADPFSLDDSGFALDSDLESDDSVSIIIGPGSVGGSTEASAKTVPSSPKGAAEAGKRLGLYLGVGYVYGYPGAEPVSYPIERSASRMSLCSHESFERRHSQQPGPFAMPNVLSFRPHPSYGYGYVPNITTVSGSQVMASYLAQTNNDSLAFASSVLHSQKMYRPPRRGRKRA